MPNNLVFNRVTEQLKTQMYAYNISTNQIEALQMDNSGNLMMTGIVDVGNTVTVTGTVDIGNTVTVAGTVDVGNTVTVAGTVDVGNTVTVTGTVDIGNTVTVAGTVDIGNTVTVAGNISSITSGVLFTTDNIIVNTGIGEGSVLQEDTSQQKMYSYYIRNNDNTNTITVALQISPTSSSEYFINDGAGFVTLGTSTATVLVTEYYMQYTRLYYDTGDNTANFEAYYNASV